MGRIIPYIMENKKCLKPPTRYGQWLINIHQSIFMNHQSSMLNHQYSSIINSNIYMKYMNHLDLRKQFHQLIPVSNLMLGSIAGRMLFHCHPWTAAWSSDCVSRHAAHICWPHLHVHQSNHTKDKESTRIFSKLIPHRFNDYPKSINLSKNDHIIII